jgi:hypothetical protein
MEFQISIITSTIAIIVALISGLFSYFSTKRSAKVEAMKTYLTFLEHKMSKLEEALSFYNSEQVSDDNKDLSESIASHMNLVFKHNCKVLSNYSYLFTQEQKELVRLTNLQKRLEFTLAALSSGLEVKEEYKNELFKPIEMVHEMDQFNKDVNTLILKELSGTFKRFEDLSLLK